MAGDSVRGSAGGTDRGVDKPAQALIDDDLAAMSIRPPDESEIRLWTDEERNALIFGQPDPPPTWYVGAGKRVTPAIAKAFVDTHSAEIGRVAIAVAERVAPYAIGDAPKIHTYATEEKLLKWSLGSPYHRGHTEEYITVAAVTYTASNGRFITIPITVGWETGTVEANFIAKRLGS